MSRAALWVGCAVLCLACQAKDPVQPIPPGPENLPPHASLAIHQTFVEGHEFSAFDTRGTSDPEGEPLRYSWDFGDGSTGTDVQAKHTYIDDGTYMVTLIVTDPHNAADTASALISIQNLAPYIKLVSLSVPPMPAAVPARAVIHVDFVEYGANDNPRLTVDWGDATISQDTIHSYTVPGTYSLSVTVADKDGGTTSQQIPGAVWVYDLSQNHSTPGYDVIDLGTLGGAEATPSAFNNLGEVVGSSTTADGKTHAFLWRNGVLTDISPAGQELSAARAINDAGWIAGAGQGDGRMPMWKDGVFTGIISVPATEYGSWPVRILNSGDVLLNVEKHEYPSAVFVRNGTAINLGGLYSIVGHAWAADINTRGQIVGSSAYQSSGAAGYDFRAFVWENGLMTELRNIGTAPCSNFPERQCGYSEARDINESGRIVGSAFNGSILRAVLWDAATRTPHDLGFGSGASRAVAINERGQIAGDSWDGNEGFFLDNGVVLSIGSLGNGGTRVAAMNEEGVVAGTSKTSGGEVHAFVWRRDTGMRDLGAGPFGATHVGTVAIAINERGDILGYAAPCLSVYGSYCYSWGQNRAILWRATTPAPVATARR